MALRRRRKTNHNRHPRVLVVTYLVPVVLYVAGGKNRPSVRSVRTRNGT